MRSYIFETKTINPFWNLAFEESLLTYAHERPCFILYFWQNSPTVIIGRHQNAYDECDVPFCKQHDIKIARRITGGGAVYHDTGNLNYTIISPREHYDKYRSSRMIVAALNDIGIEANLNGRNDICIHDMKISGNAYYSDDCVGLHHGTLLFHADMDMLCRVLNVRMEKLSKHGIPSIRSRVANIKDIYTNLTMKDIKKSICKEFCKEYQLVPCRKIPHVNRYMHRDYIKKYFSRQWNFGSNRNEKIRIDRQFIWGNISISVGENHDFEMITDALEAEYIAKLKCLIKNSLKNKNSDIMKVYLDQLAEHYHIAKSVTQEMNALIQDVYVQINHRKSDVENDNSIAHVTS